MVTRFLLKFSLLFGLPYLALNIIPLKPLLETIAFLEALMLNQTGIAAQASGVIVSTSTQVFQIVPSCSGFVMIILSFALLYSTPVNKPFRYLIVFSPALFAFNLLRLYAVLAVGTSWPQLMEPLHCYLWFVDAGLVLFLWFVAFSSTPNVKQLKPSSHKNSL